MALRPDQQVLEDAAEQQLADAIHAYGEAQTAYDVARAAVRTTHDAVFAAQKHLRDLARKFRNSSPLGDPVDL